ncbi:hypothetical protein FKW77_008214 [Venturia effusa]|uniref:L-type lectin-like domain-containing protein n=1 Tax=Venturia effusa TaxID=50376 RepID=A0A517L7S5_9PEZI|nr:hypothetical protein FKW77_008214 [Venturia effusa]
MLLPRGVLHAVAVTFASIKTVRATTWDYEPHYNEAGVTEDLTWGVHGKVWSQDHRHIQGWSIKGDGGFVPELLSDRVILTPTYPGNKRGAVWSDSIEHDDEWEAEFKFRASGPEKGSGLLQMWYATTLVGDIGTASLYTVGKFDGLVLSIGTQNGKGTLRAFVNDGTISFKDHHHVDSLLFGSCDLNYRNTGHFMRVKVRQTAWTFEVEVDDRHCFQSHKLHLPHGYHFGLTASSAETPDSFEVASFITHKLVDGQRQNHNLHNSHEEWAHDVHEHLNRIHEPSASDAYDRNSHTYHEGGKGWHWTKPEEEIKDEPASFYKTESDRFSDLHGRLTVMSHQLNMLFEDLSLFKKETEDRHEALLHYVKPLYDYAEYSKHQMETLKDDVHALRGHIEDHSAKGHIEVLKHNVQNVHELAHDLHKSSPRMGFFLAVICAFQVMLLGSYMIYRRRMKARPKKYL